VSPPASIQGRGPAPTLDQPPVEGDAVAPRQLRPSRRARVDQELVDGAGVVGQPVQVALLRDADRLHHRLAEARAHLGGALGRLAPVKLQHVDRRRLDDRLELDVGRVHRQRHHREPLGQAPARSSARLRA
jgi:hypothetical protein